MDDVRLLLDLLEVPSPSGSEGRACAVFADHARRLGFRVEQDRVGNVLATIGDGRPHTMVLGHIDTVPGVLPVHLEAGEIAGRGAVDAKGPLAAALLAAAEVGTSARGRRTVVAAVGEETDSRGVFRILRSPPPDALLVAEPGGWSRVTVGYRGHRTGVFRTTATPAHASAPTPSSLDEAVEAAQRVRTHIAGQVRTSAFRSVSCRFVDWRHVSRADEEATEFTVDVRAPRGFDWRALEAATPRIAWSRPTEAVLVDKANLVVRALVASIRRAGGEPHYVLKGGTSDMNHAARVWRIPMASYGPGDSNLDHGPGEHLSIDEFRRSIGVLEAAIRRLADRDRREPDVSA